MIWYHFIRPIISTCLHTKIYVLNQQMVPFTLNIHRMWYCYVLVLTLQESGEIGQNQANGRLQEDLMRVASPKMRVASKPKATCDATLTPHLKTRWCESHPPDTSRINCCRPIQIQPDKPQVRSVAYIRRSYARISRAFSPFTFQNT